MLSANEFRELVSGRRRGLKAAFTRGLLRLAEYPYTFEVRRRNRAFDSGRRAIQRVNVPVISVGNITLGGTGKTPMVAWLARWFQSRGIRVALVSRGYKSDVGQQNDEARELAQQLPGVPHVQNRDRAAAARQAIEQCGPQLILLDDGFQHRRLARELDIVLLDALAPFGFDHVFPRGMLREPLECLARAHVCVLTRANLIDENERNSIRGAVEKVAPHCIWAECRHAPKSLVAADGKEEPLSNLQGRRVAAFCGLGNPAGFRKTLAECECDVVAWREFPDHHHYSQDDVEDLSRWAASRDAEFVVCTQKDLVKLNIDSLGRIALSALRIEIDFTVGQAAFEQSLERIAAKAAG